jgi:hypothetical protein
MRSTVVASSATRSRRPGPRATSGPTGPVRVGAGEGARIREAYPSLALEVRNQRDMESFDQLLAGELDLRS